MNSLEAYSIENPQNKVDVCAKFTIDDHISRYILPDILFVGQRYTLSMWVKSESEGSVTIADETIATTNEWRRLVVTFVAAKKELAFRFGSTGIYYVYHSKLEIGNKVTDWSPAPEDADDKVDHKLNDVNESILTIHEAVSDLTIDSNGIKAEVSDLKTTVDGVTGRIASTEEALTTVRQTSENLDVRIQNITNNGVTRVATETGFTFDREGMTVDSTDSPTKTQVTPDGMTVYTKTSGGGQSEVLEATSEGVDATNLHAKTYLIIGGRSRFENYGSNRTGCFWIGG